MMDDKLTQGLQSWLSAPAEGRDMREGAEMLLRLSRNRILHQNILRRPDKFAAKLEYELRKHLRIRLDGLTRREVVLMEREVMPLAKETLEAGCPLPSPMPGGDTPVPEETGETPPQAQGEEATAEAPSAGVLHSDDDQPAPACAGRRADHDALPPEIQALYEQNGELWHRIKQTYNTLLSMEKLEPCDRYEHLRMLKELDARYRENWRRYDGYDPAAAPQPSAPEGTEAPATAASAVSAARKYLSSNRKKLESLPPGEARDRLAAAMQERVDLVLAAGEGFKDDYRARLEALGLEFGLELEEVKRELRRS